MAARTLLKEAQHADMARTLRGAAHRRAVSGLRAAGARRPEGRSRAEGDGGGAGGREGGEGARGGGDPPGARTGADRGRGIGRGGGRDRCGGGGGGDRSRRARDRRGGADATRSQLVEWLGEDGEIQALFEAREAELTAAEAAFAAAKEAVQERRDVLDRAKEEAAGSARDLAQLANRLAGSWGRLGRDDAVVPEQEEVRAAFRALREAIVAAHDEAVARGEAARARAADAERGLAELFVAIGLGRDEDFTAALAGAGVRHGAAAARVTELEATIARAGDLEADILAAEARRDVADRLAKDLQPSRFLAFLLEEERAELAELGSEHLDQLTGGSYRFSEDDRFDIVDLNAAGQVRRSDSLSGGETFLASLALALALAEMVARGGGRLDAFFLDEGFGSLDPEHLDRAMEGIGRLVAGDEHRLVVLVSHVAEMREAIEDLVVLGKDDLTGDTLVLSGARPGLTRPGPRTALVNPGHLGWAEGLLSRPTRADTTPGPERSRSQGEPEGDDGWHEGHLSHRACRAHGAGGDAAGVDRHHLPDRRVEALDRRGRGHRLRPRPRPGEPRRLPTGDDLVAPVDDGRARSSTRPSTASILNGEIDAVTIWDPDGTIVYSTDADLIGTRLPEERFRLREILKSGTASTVQDGMFSTRVPLAPESTDAEAVAQLDRVYAPIWDATAKPWRTASLSPEPRAPARPRRDLSGLPHGLPSLEGRMRAPPSRRSAARRPRRWAVERVRIPRTPSPTSAERRKSWHEPRSAPPRRRSAPRHCKSSTGRPSRSCMRPRRSWRVPHLRLRPVPTLRSRSVS